MLYQHPGFVLKINVSNGFKEAGIKQSKQVEADNLRGIQHDMPDACQGPPELQESIEVTGSRQADIRGFRIQARV